MRRLIEWIGIAAILGAIGLTAACVGGQVRQTEGVAQYYMDYVCDLMRLDCTGVEPPVIVTTNLLNRAAPEGRFLKGVVYPGEKFLLVNSKMPMAMQAATTVHEMTHYVIHTLAPDTPYCDGEELARMVTAVWNGVEYNEDWRPLYECEVTDGE